MQDSLVISPPSRRRFGLVCVLLIVVTSAVTLTAADTSRNASAAAEQSCRYDSYDPPTLDSEWDETYADALDNGSLEDWTNGQIVRVGASGDCSLAVTDGESTTLTATAVNGTRGVVTGVVDLGSNGSLRLTEGNRSAPSNGTHGSGAAANVSEPTETNASGIVIANRGPDYGNTIEIVADARSERLSLSTGRFFEFAIRQDNGTVQIAVWDADDRWDRKWDRRFENATVDGDWRLTLDGRAFLDGIAVGVDEPNEPTTAETATTTTEDTGPYFGDDPDSGSGPDQGSDSSGTVLGGIVLLALGAIEVRYARQLTRFGEQLDAIGSTTRASEVEPAEWNVWLTKIFGMVIAGVGLLLIGLSIL